jgi:hypothetical protein
MGAAGSPESGGSGRVLGRVRCGGGLGTHPSLVCALIWGGEAGGEGARRRSWEAAARACAPAMGGDLDDT